MAVIFNELRKRFKSGSILHQYIYINVGVFVVMFLVSGLLRLFNVETSLFDYLELPSSIPLLIRRPWTLFTYMFVHRDLLHLFFNMLWLYWLGQIFLKFFTGRQFGGLYVLGGLAGALLFIIFYNLFPYFRNVAADSFMVGASASVMAIVFAVAFYQKDYEINLVLFGRMKLVYLVLLVLLFDLLMMTKGDNEGGHIAHVGGALFGILYAYEYSKGKDMTRSINRWIDKFVNFLNHKPSFKVTYSKRETNKEKKRPETDGNDSRRSSDEESVIDAILDKLKHSGYGSLSEEEKKKLFEASRK